MRSIPVRFSLPWAIMISLVIFNLSLLVTSFRLSAGPDIFTDEIIYTRVGVRIAGEGALVWDTGDPFLVHPPLYFLAAGTYHLLTGDPDTPLYAPGNIFSTVFHARMLNSVFAAFTAVVLYWFGRQLSGDWLGLFYVALYFLDPFALRINRRAMLETLSVSLCMAALLAFFIDLQRSTSRMGKMIVSPWTVLAGLLLGGALLTKELAFVYLLIPIFYGVWEVLKHSDFTRNAPDKPARAGFNALPLRAVLARCLVTVGVALLTYAIYPAWVASFGSGSVYLSEKSLGLMRLLGLVQITGWNRPGISFFALLLERLSQYGSSYVILLLGGLAAIPLVFLGSNRISGRLLASAALALYPPFTFIALFGSGNDQFFYFLLPPAILLLGYTLLVFPRQAENPKTIPKIVSKGILYASYVAGAFLALVLCFNFWRWWTNYVTGADNAYTQFSTYVSSNLPPGEPINASGDPIKFRYFLPDHPISFAATLQEASMTGVRYYALAPKDVQMRYGRIQPELAAWIESSGNRIFTTGGSSYGDVYLYRVDAVPVDPSRTIITGEHAAQGSRFGPALAGEVSSLVLALILAGLVAALIIVMLNRMEEQRDLAKLNAYLATLFSAPDAKHNEPPTIPVESRPVKPKDTKMHKEQVDEA